MNLGIAHHSSQSHALRAEAEGLQHTFGRSKVRHPFGKMMLRIKSSLSSPPHPSIDKYIKVWVLEEFRLRLAKSDEGRKGRRRKVQLAALNQGIKLELVSSPKTTSGK